LIDFCPDKRELWHWGADLRAKFHVYPGKVSPLRGEKPIFGPLSENNTGMAALRAGLPVTNKRKTSHFFVYSRRDPQSPPYVAR